MLDGALTTAILVCILKKTETEYEEQATYEAESFDSLVTEGEAQILTITACPSGVAHNFLAAKSLENAGHKLGVKIKV